MVKDITTQEAEHIQRIAKRGQYREALQQLATAKGDFLTPYDVLDDARDENSLLHNVFEWDDSIAGEKYRLMQARILINTVRVTVNGTKTPAFFNTRVKLNDEMVQGYFPLARVMSDEEVHKAVLRDAIHDLEYAQEKYKEISELKGVINTKKLEKVKAQINN